MDNNLEHNTQETLNTRTYAAKEAVRLAREKVRRNDMIVSQLMTKSELGKLDSGPTHEIIHESPGELSRPGSRGVSSLESDGANVSDSGLENIQEEENDGYRIKTGTTFFSFFRDLLD